MRFPRPSRSSIGMGRSASGPSPNTVSVSASRGPQPGPAPQAGRPPDRPSRTTILFLKHLERIDVEVDTSERSETFGWAITRTLDDEEKWSPVTGLSRTGLYRVESTRRSECRAFLVAHDDDLEIEAHRGGLDEYAWSGVELSEVSVAVHLSMACRPRSIKQHACCTCSCRPASPPPIR